MEPSLSKQLLPPGGTRGVVLLSSRVWKDVKRLGTRDWYLMPYSSPVITGGQKHTHTLCVCVSASGYEGGCWSVLGPFSRASRSNLKLTSLTSRFLPFTKNYGDSVAFSLVVGIVPGSFLSRERLQHSPSSPFFFCSIASVGHETRFLGQDWARHPSVHHRCHRCPFVRLPGFVRYLRLAPR